MKDQRTILVTAIGTHSSECVIKALKKDEDFRIIGCDIHPAEWHAFSNQYDAVYRVPKGIEGQIYLDAIFEICKKENVEFILPLTDVEVDILNVHRDLFSEKNITLCMPSSFTLNIARNKYNLYKFFSEDSEVHSIKSYKGNEKIQNPVFPYIAKPVDGRSSEGIVFIKTPDQFTWLEKETDYIIQEVMEGPIYTVDYIRNDTYSTDFSIPREELLRTVNGAGMTVRIAANKKLHQLASRIGEKLKVHGCVNMEFIKNEGEFFLIDINPRFSAGLAFSHLAGYDFVNNHLNCFLGMDLHELSKIKPMIAVKTFVEVITKEG